MSFREALSWIVFAEVGADPHQTVSDDPADHGGRTVMGLSTPTYDQWRDTHSLPRQAVDQVTVIEWRRIYWEWFWRATRSDELPPRLAVAVFDAAANQGPEAAISMLQRTVFATPDGHFGPKTKIALEQALALHGETLVIDGFLEWRALRYERIAQRDPTQAKWLLFWKRRLEELRGFLTWMRP